MTKFYEYVWFGIDMGGGVFGKIAIYVDFFYFFHIFVRKIETIAPICKKLYVGVSGYMDLK